MWTLIRSASMVAVPLFALVAAGCASGKDGTTPVAAGGMMCPKCETVWVTKRVGTGTKVDRLVSERKMTCPDCDAMAQSQLTEDGKVMLHECPTCKVTPKAISPSQSPSHAKGTHG